MKKIFVIGFNKTGTTSFDTLFIKLGINSTHDCSDIPVMEIIDKYDAFTDGEHLNFQEYFKKYPDSLFILNTRPMKNWLISRYKHAEHHQFNECWCWPISEEKTNNWITTRETHHKNVIQFFKNKPNKLLLINIEQNGWENAVIKYLQKFNNIKKDVNLNNLKIHKNKRDSSIISKDKISLINDNVTNCLKNMNYTENEILFKGFNKLDYKFNMFL
jgi:hypothetical protein